MEAWLGLPRQKYAISYNNEHVHFVRRMFELAVADRVIAESPVHQAKAVKRETPIRQTPSWQRFKDIVVDIRAEKFNADAAE